MYVCVVYVHICVHLCISAHALSQKRSWVSSFMILYSIPLGQGHSLSLEFAVLCLSVCLGWQTASPRNNPVSTLTCSGKATAVFRTRTCYPDAGI